MPPSMPPRQQINVNCNEISENPVVVVHNGRTIGNHLTSTPIIATSHLGKDEQNTQEQLTPHSGSISETSTSPEKGSDTSSGIHSNSSSNATNSTLPNVG